MSICAHVHKALGIAVLLASSPVLAAGDGRWDPVSDVKITAGEAEAYAIWRSSDNDFHVRWTATKEKGRLFAGKIRTDGKYVKRSIKPLGLDVGDKLRGSPNRRLIWWKSGSKGGLEGFDVKIKGGKYVLFELAIEGDFAPVDKIWIGKDRKKPHYAVFSFMRNPPAGPFPNLPGMQDLPTGKQNGLWWGRDDNAVHRVLVTTDGGEHTFRGWVKTDGLVYWTGGIEREKEDRVVREKRAKRIRFRFKTKGGKDGFRFRLAAARKIQMKVTMDGKPMDAKLIHLGKDGASPSENPFTLSR